MTRYSNRSGTSGVHSFEVGQSSIVVVFQDGSAYLYDSTRPGAHHVSRMIQHANAGHGLNGYINRHVQKNYAKKLR